MEPKCPDNNMPVLLFFLLMFLSVSDSSSHRDFNSCTSDSVLNEAPARHKRTMALDDRRWTKGIVPYVFTDSVSAYHREEIIRGMHTYERWTCIRFEPWTVENGVTTNQRLGLGHVGYLGFVSDDGACRGPLGMKNEEASDIQCCTQRTCIHELGHAMGMTHEAPSPDRDGWIRVNFENILPHGRYPYEQWKHEEVVTYGYDIQSVMHYRDWAFNNGKGPTYTYLFPELKQLPAYNHYYVMMEVSRSHRCRDLFCPNFNVACVNDGYATLVDNRCACRCLYGLDPSTGCATILKSDPAEVGFPGGTYGLPKTTSDCPQFFTYGSRIHYGPGGNTQSDQFDLAGGAAADKAEHHFCISSSPETDIIWPGGNYCIYRKGGTCPEGFKEGSVTYDDSPRAGKENSVSGDLPDGTFTDNTQLQFCCRSDGFSDDQLYLPSRQPLALFKIPDYRCHDIRGMHSREEELAIKSSDQEGVASVTGLTPIYNQDDNIFYTAVCYYTPATIDCGDVYELSASNPTVTFSSTPGSELECNWLIKAPEGESIVLDFDEFDVRANEDGSCADSLEIRYVRLGQYGEKACGTGRDKSTRSILNTIFLTLRTYGNTDSHFTATARLVSELDHCYPFADRGMSYAGTVNFTRALQPCLRWDEVAHCPHHAFKADEQEVTLDENYCRNPKFKDGFRPWCYTKAHGCERNYCDVCRLESPYDKYERCSEMLSQGVCEDQHKAFESCAKTCQTTWPLPSAPPKARTIHCGPPPDVADAAVVSATSQTYDVGNHVTYRCRSNSLMTARRTCLTSGQWSFLSSVCTECLPGWHFFSERCYKYFPDQAGFAQAKATCENKGAEVATAKTKKENDMVHSLIQGGQVYLALTDDVVEGEWRWLDGSPLTGYTNWEQGEPNSNGNQDCAVLVSYNKWNDLACYPNRGVVCSMRKETTVCADKSPNCITLFNNAPDFCTEHATFSNQFCAYTCGFCGASTSCSVPAPSANIIQVRSTTSLARGSVVKYECAQGLVRVSGHLVRGCLATGQLTGQPLVCARKEDTISEVNDHPFATRGSLGHWGYAYTGNNDNFRIDRSGEVVRWEYYSTNEGLVTFQIWRPRLDLGTLKFELVGQNLVENTPKNFEWKLDVPQGERIQVQPGDVLGIFYGYNNRGGVVYNKCNSEDHPEAANIVWSASQYGSYQSLSPGQVVTFDPSTSCRTFTFKAVICPTSGHK